VPAKDRSDPRTSRARRLRREATPAERKLWGQLRLLELPGGHFRRQVPIGPYFADFAHHGLKLVVELDGGQHGLGPGLRHDAARTSYLERSGYRVLRFWNNEVAENLDGVVETIFAAIARVTSLDLPSPARRPPPPSPAPPQAGGGGQDGASPC
jgi:very-short-patch-repair endonuclease